MKRLLVFLLSFCLLTGCGTAPKAESAPPPGARLPGLHGLVQADALCVHGAAVRLF